MLEKRAHFILALLIIIMPVLAGGFFTKLLLYKTAWKSDNGNIAYRTKNLKASAESERGTVVTPTSVDSIEKAVSLVLNPATSGTYKSEKPAYYDLVTSGVGGPAFNVAPKGAVANVYVRAQEGWDKGLLTDVETFYLEAVTCKENGLCSAPTFFGPFSGQLKLLIQ